MELRQLRYFVAVAEEGHFGRAAHRLRIATPTLSQQLRVLERDVRAVLVDRRRPGALSLTPAGKVLLRHARILLARADRARDELLAAHGNSEQITLRVASGAEHVLGPQLRCLADEVTHLDVVTISSVTVDAVRAVREETADAAIVWNGIGRERGLTVALLRHVPVHLALPRAHALAGAASVNVADLAEETIVLFPRSLSPPVWDRFYRHLLPGGVTRPDQVCTQPDAINAPEAVLRAVAAGMGLAPAVEATALHAMVDGIVLRALDPPLSLPLKLIWREPASASLLQLVALLAADPQ
jgi:DNA-binding transcriptional LysR family regulator